MADNKMGNRVFLPEFGQFRREIIPIFHIERKNGCFSPPFPCSKFLGVSPLFPHVTSFDAYLEKKGIRKIVIFSYPGNSRMWQTSIVIMVVSLKIAPITHILPSFSVREMNVTQHLKHVACGGEKRMALGNRRLVSLSPLPVYVPKSNGCVPTPVSLMLLQQNGNKKENGLHLLLFYTSAVTFLPEILGYQNERVSHSLPLWVIFRYEGVFKILNLYSLSLYISRKREFLERILRIFPART